MTMIINPYRFPAPGAGASTMPTYVGVSTFDGASGGISISFANSGRTAGSLLIIGVGTAAETAATPSGWTDLGFVNEGGVSNSSAAGLDVFYKISDGTETSVSMADVGDLVYAQGIVVDGVNQSTPIHAHTPTNAYGSSQSIAGPVTTIDNCFIIGFSANGDDVTFSNLANANLASLTERINQRETASHDGALFGFTGELAMAGAVGDTTFTTSQTRNAASRVIAVAPA